METKNERTESDPFSPAAERIEQAEEATPADLAATIRRWVAWYPDGECCMCQSPLGSEHDEECRVPALLLAAEYLDTLTDLQHQRQQQETGHRLARERDMKFRKKPVVIEAIQFDGSVESADSLRAWCGGRSWRSGGGFEPSQPSRWVIDIATLEGVMRAEPGDWVIRGVKGEFYPCKPDIFAATYEEVSEDQT